MKKREEKLSDEICFQSLAKGHNYFSYAEFHCKALNFFFGGGGG